jgi:FtsH-binding integral membrane protein
MADTVYGIAFGLIIAGAIMKWSNSPRVKDGKVFLWVGLILLLVTTAIDYQNIWKDFKAGWEEGGVVRKSSDSAR